MYIPKQFLITDQQEAISFMQRYSFATIVTVSDGVPSATHLPFVVSQRDDKIILTSHFAKVNPQAAEILNGKPLVIFIEPHAYISPKHYETEQSVPTWNYIAIHAYGTTTLIENPEQKAELLEHTIQFYEADYLKQWAALPQDFKLNMMKGITGFEIVVDELQGKKKLSQNKTEKERDNIINELSNKPDSNEKEIAAYMSKLK
ncbi:MAG: transcriptional regulator [Mucilaginibacter sp.]|uniref:FMN-binding negative transcriptional regulator n=1 Tax=Mucilaginibacter sp. TaxID=1882438 RepID=UPI0026130489|nr:FMN-binding negative transcriptional regulator [Mucilaginibacter sp.]MDB5002927.1 transcriptional regulator [Mucilaginibacter sp.]